jgi:hypothetical protein
MGKRIVGFGASTSTVGSSLYGYVGRVESGIGIECRQWCRLPVLACVCGGIERSALDKMMIMLLEQKSKEYSTYHTGTGTSNKLTVCMCFG